MKPKGGTVEEGDWSEEEIWSEDSSDDGEEDVNMEEEKDDDEWTEIEEADTSQGNPKILLVIRSFLTSK